MNRRGIAFIIVLGFTLLLGVISTGFIILTNNEITFCRKIVDSHKAFYLAEAGIEKATFALAKNDAYAGETNIALGGGAYDVVVTQVGAQKQIDAIGYVPTKAAPRARREILVTTVRPDNPIAVTSAVTGGGAVTVSGNAKIKGKDLAGITVPSGTSVSISGSATVSGDPQIAYSPTPTFEAVFGMSETQMKLLATVYTNPNNNVPNPANGVTWIEGNATYTSSQWEGDGILIVTGNLELRGGEFKGVIYVKGSATVGVGNPEIEGALISLGTGDYKGSSEIKYEEEEIEDIKNYYPYTIFSWKEV